MRIALVGCGFVADLYMRTLRQHPHLEVSGVVDRDPQRASRFSAHHGLAVYRSLDEALADPRLDAVVNLTNPRSHYDVSMAALTAGKHVYSEKPLALELADAKRLVEVAQSRGLMLSAAPCNLLGQTAQTVWRAIREGALGHIRVAYAELDDGMVHRMPYRKWKSESGAVWPWKDEFEVGCTMEHAAYYLTWLAAFFGPAESVTAFSTCQIPDKQTDMPLDVLSPDFSVACIRFLSGAVARLTCGIIAPHDHSLRVVGDDGVLSTGDCWDFCSPVYVRRLVTFRRKAFMNPWKRRYPLLKTPDRAPRRWGAARMDFCCGIAEMADAIAAGRSPRLSADFCLHVNEMVLAIQNAGRGSAAYAMTTTFKPIEPMPWAR